MFCPLLMGVGKEFGKYGGCSAVAVAIPAVRTGLFSRRDFCSPVLEVRHLCRKKLIGRGGEVPADLGHVPAGKECAFAVSCMPQDFGGIREADGNP